MSRRNETSRANFAEFQDHIRLVATNLSADAAVSDAVLRGYRFLRSLPAGSPVDYGDHLGALTTREEMIEHVQRFAKRRGIELEVVR